MNLILDNWNKNDYKNFLKYLLEIKENAYKEFNKKLIPTKYELLGIRIPYLRNIAKDISKGNYIEFLNQSNNKYFEEVMIKGFVISKIKDDELFDKYLEEYIDEIDNWSLCDCFCSSIKRVKNKDKYFKKFKKLTKSNKEYYVRVGLVGILFNFVNDKYIDEIFEILDSIKLDVYYVNMAAAWLLCECFIKQRDKTLKYIDNSSLNDWSFNKGIQKCIESFRVTKEDKVYLRNKKRKA